MKIAGFACCICFALTIFAQAITIDELVADQAQWPRTVQVSVSLKAPIVVGGRVAGSITLPPGKEYQVARITRESVFVQHGSQQLEVPIAQTNLLELAKISAPPASPPSSAPVPAPSAAPASAGTAPAPLPPSPKASEVTIAEVQRPAAPNSFAGALFRDAVVFEGDQLQQVADPGFLEASCFLVLYSGWWNLPSRGMTSVVERLEDSLAERKDRFRVVLASLDRDDAALIEHLEETGIAWPVIPPSRLAASPLGANRPAYLPALVLFSADGQILAQSYNGREFLGHRPVLEALEAAVK